MNGDMRDQPPRLLLVSGSPSLRSKTSVVLAIVANRALAAGAAVQTVSVRDFPADALLFADVAHASLQTFLAQVAWADAIVIATPIYKASYTGVLKALLDVVPPGAFAGKAVLPLATAGTLAHFLALDFALRPVLSFLGARDTLGNVFLLESSFRDAAAGVLEEAAEERLSNGIADLLAVLGCPGRIVSQTHSAGVPAA
jgi:FMN reductase